ncbi:carbohydrate ABC transporter permease [Flavimobilis sp. GY10621]|uniref:Carbohydrate ABC transporter permease n=1 Tax=Flavimobilis rhizosphaerae TaxID=2775421 RepID=A0ABR9DMD8_9MICO|nr:carbohydrate ABC transporter permease [Flavimobilis rhizosphaerae]MBD9698295.1 carbohydrate ABC transporter permease [Flavimobilis rhizosphaerae]
MSSIPVIAQTAGPGAARAAGRRSSRRHGSFAGGERRAGKVTYTILAIFVLLSAFPFYWSFLIGSKDNDFVFSGSLNLVPGPNFLDNVRRVLESDINFWGATLNSLVAATSTSVSVVLLSTLAGFSFAKLRFKGRRGLLVSVIATMAVPTQLGIVPLYLVMTKLNLQGNLLAIILPGLVTAFGVFWMTQYLQDALPDELIDAARVDGCNLIRTFWHVAMPAARPAAAMLFLFTFVGSWTNFMWPYVILDRASGTLPVALQGLQSQYYTDYPLILTGALLSVVPLLILFVVAGKQLVAGIMAGAVKG